MRWMGSLIGAYMGGRLLAPLGLFFSLIGCLAGAVLGGKAAGALLGDAHTHPRRRKPPPDAAGEDRAKVFCASIAAMLAKMAKADGVVTRVEIDRVEMAFRRLGFTPAARRYAIDVFRRAKDDSWSIYDYAHQFAEAVDSIEVRELLYEILWDLACADGSIGQAELVILQRIPRSLGIRTEWYGYFYSRILGGRQGNRRSAGARGQSRAEPQRNSLDDAYAILGASPNDSAEVLKRKYRELAKRNHPDALRAQGLPEAMVGKATERMSRINSAWAEIKEARGI